MAQQGPDDEFPALGKAVGTAYIVLDSSPARSGTGDSTGVLQTSSGSWWTLPDRIPLFLGVLERPFEPLLCHSFGLIAAVAALLGRPKIGFRRSIRRGVSLKQICEA